MQTNTSITMLNTSLIIPNKYQPRKVFDEKALDKLSESIKIYGIINPILVRKKDDKYEIIAGERRFRAAMKIGLTEVPVIIKNADEQQMAELALIENLERQELTAIEEAKSYEEIMQIGNQTQASLASKLGKSQSYIANKIRLLSLPQEIQDALSHKKISERHARSLLSVENKDRQLELLNRIMSEKLTVKETEEIINTKNIDEEEIKQAISDIMKSLNIQEDEEQQEYKKEEKEDDNMNNGNFFPNFDNNNAANNNASLNMMNMQSMNQTPMAPEPEVVMPTTMNQPAIEPTLMAPNQQPMPTAPIDMQPQVSVPMVDEPLFNTNVVMPTSEPVSMVGPTLEPVQPMEPTLNMAPSVASDMQPVETPMFNNAPLFGPQPIEPLQQESVLPTPSVDMQPQVSVPMVDEPLFNPNVVMPTSEPVVSAPVMSEPVPMVEPINPLITPTPFEVPVVAESSILPEASPVTANRLQELQDLLNSNGYQFKVYGNDTTDCIIIELPRN